MRHSVTAALLFAALTSGFCQEQERKIMDRMLKPDLSRSSGFNGKAFDKQTSFTLKESSESKDAYIASKKAYSKDFAYTRSFLGVKNPWFGGKVYDSKQAGKWANTSPWGADKTFQTRSTDAQGFYQEKKEANFGSPVVPVKEFIPQGGAQGATDQMTERVKKEMTIDDVREILNKSK